MNQIIILLILNSLFIFGFKFVTWYEPAVSEGADKKTELFTLSPTIYQRELLWWISFYGKKYFGYEFMKPVSLCPMCMSSVWGAIFFWCAIFSNVIVCATLVHVIAIWLVYTVALCGLNHLISQFA